MGSQESLFVSDAPTVEAEERTSGRERRDDDIDDVLIKWIAEARVAGPPPTDYQIRVARFKNGRRGVQWVRRYNGKVTYGSSLVLHPDEYYGLAKCVFRDSLLIRRICERFPDGTDPDVDALRAFIVAEH